MESSGFGPDLFFSLFLLTFHVPFSSFSAFFLYANIFWPGRFDVLIFGHFSSFSSILLFPFLVSLAFTLLPTPSFPPGVKLVTHPRFDLSSPVVLSSYLTKRQVKVFGGLRLQVRFCFISLFEKSSGLPLHSLLGSFALLIIREFFGAETLFPL